MTDYAFETSVAVRYRDLDTYGHVNNSIFGTYMEEARIEYLREVLDLDHDERGMLVVSLAIDFQAPIDGDAVTVGLGITRIGEKSFEIEYELEADGRTVATGESVQVAYDLKAGETIPFPEPWREVVQEFEGGRVEFAKPDGN